jgi:hypothetical protein
MISVFAMLLILNGKQLKKPEPVQLPVSKTWPYRS